jgi:hypothetical protein
MPSLQRTPTAVPLFSTALLAYSTWGATVCGGFPGGEEGGVLSEEMWGVGWVSVPSTRGVCAGGGGREGVIRHARQNGSTTGRNEAARASPWTEGKEAMGRSHACVCAQRERGRARAALASKGGEPPASGHGDLFQGRSVPGRCARPGCTSSDCGRFCRRVEKNRSKEACVRGSDLTLEGKR